MTKSEKFKITIQNYNIQQLQQTWIKTSNVSHDLNSMNHYDGGQAAVAVRTALFCFVKILNIRH